MEKNLGSTLSLPSLMFLIVYHHEGNFINDHCFVVLDSHLWKRVFFSPPSSLEHAGPSRWSWLFAKKMSYRTALFETGWLIWMIQIIYYDYHNDNDDDEDHVDSHKNSGGHSPFDPSARTGLHSIYTRHYTSPSSPPCIGRIVWIFPPRVNSRPAKLWHNAAKETFPETGKTVT